MEANEQMVSAYFDHEIRWKRDESQEQLQSIHNVGCFSENPLESVEITKSNVRDFLR